jgi:CheY-like chemotaxis protein
MRVLVVDDSSTMRRIIVNALKKLGYEDTVEAGDGREALMTLGTTHSSSRPCGPSRRTPRCPC